jgi:hypothetical protein
MIIITTSAPTKPPRWRNQMNPKETLINLFAALAITVISQPIAQALAGDFLLDIFGTEQPAQ